MNKSQAERDEIVREQYIWWKDKHHINNCIPLDIFKQKRDKNIER